MKKRKKLIICVLAVVVMVATLFVGCTPTDKPTKDDVKYAVTPLADLTDYSSTANKPAVPYTTTSSDYTEVRDKLAAKIKTQKSYYDACENGASTYVEYKGNDLVTGETKTIDGEQSSLLKLLAHADADQLIYVLGYSGLAQDKMIKLVEYIAKEGTVAYSQSKPKEATGLIEDYEAIRDWGNKLDSDGDDAQHTIYKNRARKSRAMNEKLFATGMDGGDAGRVMLEVFEYVQVVAEEMRDTYNKNHVGAGLADMTEYFKKELLDYDTVVLIRANNDRRWGTAGQVKGAMNKKVSFNGNNYNGSYSKPSTDSALVQAYGYSFEYERGNYNALTEEEFEKELDYRFKNNLSLDEAKEYSRIQRKQYEKAFRYSYEFYNNKYYPALDPINLAQENYEAKVFGFNNSDSVDGEKFYGASSKIKVQGVGGTKTEETITVDLGGDKRVQNRDKNKNFYADMSYQAVKIGLKDQLIAGDMQHYYWGIDDNVKAQNDANNDRMSDNAGTQAKGNFNLKLVNLKMADFVLSTFVSEKNTGGLANLMKAQTRLYLADYARTINAYRRQVVRELAKLEKEGVLKAEPYEIDNGKEIHYELQTGAYTDTQKDTIEDIGRAAAMIKNLNNKRSELDVDSKDTSLLSTDWKVISGQIKDTVNYNYNELGAANWGAKSKKLDDVLIHKDENGKYDTNWATSVFVNNNSAVLAYSSGQVAIDFRVASGLSNDGKISGRTSYKDIVYGYSGETLNAIISAHDDGGGLNFSTLTSNSGATTYTATAKKDKYYLVWDDQTGNYYYEVSIDKIIEYDMALFVLYDIR